jgi:hypothetical protein
VTDLQAAYSRLRVMYVAHIPSDEERNRVKGALLAYRLMLFEDSHREMHQAHCALSPCDCQPFLLVRWP